MGDGTDGADGRGDRAAGRPVVYLESRRERKEARALDIARADGVTEGLIAVRKCVEPCQTFPVGGNRAAKKLVLRPQSGKCSHLYFYVPDPQLGLTHLRLQMWVPFSIHVCLNGRDWLARQLTRAAIGFDQRDNCLVDVDDIAAAQALLSRPLQTNWSGLWDGLVTRWHPTHQTMFTAPPPPDDHGSAGETEWATADLNRRAALSQKSNGRDRETPAAVDHDEPLGETVRPICQPTEWHGRRVRGLQPPGPDDSRLLAAVIRGEFALNGFRNRDLRPLLFGDNEIPADEVRRQSAKITRLLRLLRGHGLIQKVPKTHRDTLTGPGRQTITALQIAQQTSTQQLAKLAV